MNHWLIKSEPSAWSWDQQVAAGEAGEPWTGVRNHTAKLNLMAMKLGDLAFFYHSQDGKAVVGVCKVVREAYPDPTAPEGSPWVCCDFAALKPALKPVTLEQVKQDPALKDMALVKLSRLSVQPVTAAEWKRVCDLAGL